MTLCHSTNPEPACTEPFRWDQPTIALTHDRFQEPGHPSQRQYARDHGIPRSTLGAWLRRDPAAGHPDLEPEAVAFFRSAAGLRFLRRLVLALFLAFVFGGPGGLRRLTFFLRRTGLDRFVASSTGALHEMAQHLQADLAAFADEERPRLAEGLPHRHIAVIGDENFHGSSVCLVACEPASNFILLEQYTDRRDGATWTAAIQQAVAGLLVTPLVLTSDQAKGLIACANNGLEAWHVPELFHGQRDLCRPVMGPLQRQQRAADEAVREATEHLQGCRAEAEQAAQQPARPGRPKDHARHVSQAEAQLAESTRQARACAARQEQAVQAVRGLADDFHPFDGQSGAKVEEAQLEERLGQRLRALEGVVEQAGLGQKAQDALARGRRWVGALVAALGWFWGVARACVDELGLPEEAQQAVYGQLLPGLYWQQAAGRARTAEDRRQKEALAERLLAKAWDPGGPLGRLAEGEREAVRRVALEVVGLFARSSSCVEGRNGRLALFQHGQTRLSSGRLKALTAVHNYLAERADGTTAAERFFGRKPRDLFRWLLERLPDLPQPAARRPRKVRQTTAQAG